MMFRKVVAIILLIGGVVSSAKSQFWQNYSPGVAVYVSGVSNSMAFTLDKTKKNWYSSLGVTYQFWDFQPYDWVTPTNAYQRLGATGFLGRGFGLENTNFKIVFGIQSNFRKGLLIYPNDIFNHLEIQPAIKLLKNKPKYSWYVQGGTGLYLYWGIYNPEPFPGQPMPFPTQIGPESFGNPYLIQIGFIFHGKRGSAPSVFMDIDEVE